MPPNNSALLILAPVIRTLRRLMREIERVDVERDGEAQKMVSLMRRHALGVIRAFEDYERKTVR